LLIATPSREAELSDVDFGRWLEYGGGRVVRFDAEAAYCRGGMALLEGEFRRVLRDEGVAIVVYPLGTEFDFRPDFLQSALAGVYGVLLVGDDEHYFDVSHRYYAQCFDLVLSTNPLCERYRLYGVEAQFLPGTFDPAVFSPGTDKEKNIDVSFVGAMHKQGRAAYARALVDAGIALQAYGAGTTAGILPRERVVEVYRRSRINLNFTGTSGATHLDAGISINRRIRQVKARCQMIALCGSFVLSENAPGLERVFDVGNEIDVFEDENDLVDKVRFYLAHDTVREEMAARAHARAKRDYDVRSYGAQLARSLEARARGKRQRPPMPLYLDRPFWSAYGAWRFKYIAVYLFSMRIALLCREIALLLRTRRFDRRAASWAAAMGLLVAARTSPFASRVARGAKALRDRARRPASASHG
jgi:hypothetical protein